MVVVPEEIEGNHDAYRCRNPFVRQGRLDDLDYDNKKHSSATVESRCVESGDMRMLTEAERADGQQHDG